MPDTKSAFASKVNWTQLVSLIAVFATLFGFDLSAETQAQVVATITAVASAATVVWRTWFTTKRIA